MSSGSKFPAGFLWGTATSSYQIEGDNFNSDWHEWEERGKTKDKAGKACDYWNRWKEDHKLIEELGVNAFRLSLEWARIEPEEGKYSQEAIMNYRNILQDLRRRNIKTIVTLWHWTSPIWFQKKYGFHRKSSVAVFSDYVREVAEKLGDVIDVYVVLNEPMVPLGMGFMGGAFPPGFKNPFKLWRATNNMARAYVESYKIIHEIQADAQVGISYLYNWYESEGLGLLKLIDRLANWYRIDFLGDKIRQYQDYVGIDYYRLGRIEFDWKKLFRLDTKNQTYFGFTIKEDPANVMKWIIYPEGIYKVIKEAGQKYNLPIYIIENGMPGRLGIEDEERIEFMRKHLQYIAKAISEGADVRGYNQWSFMDNYEWLFGFEPRFGLVEIDYETLERKPRKSYYAYRDLIKENQNK